MKRTVVIGSPYLLQFNLLTACEYSCSYCYLSDLRNKKGSHLLRAKDYKRFISKFGEYSSKYHVEISVNITGGNIWLHPEIGEILDHTYSQPFINNFGLMVNDLSYKDSRKMVESVKSKLDIVQLNIDSLSSGSDDVAFLQEMGVRSCVKIMLSNSKNYLTFQTQILEDLLSRFKSLLVSFDRLCPVYVEQFGNVLETGGMLKVINSINTQYPGRVVTNDPLIKAYLMTGASTDFNSKEDLSGCVIPNSGLSIYPDAAIKLCARIPGFETGFDIDNFDLISYIEKYSALLNKRKEGCEVCRYFLFCQGGCPATSFLSKERIFARDINCLLEYEKR